MPEPATIDLRNRHLAAFLAYLVPGLGHLYQRRYGKAILYSVSILGLFYFGLWLGHWHVVVWRWVNPLQNSERFCIHYLGQFFAGLASLPALIQATLTLYETPSPFGDYLAEPSANVLNALYTNPGGRVVEIATMATTIAGLLNILAIYDAYEGPAYHQEELEADAKKKAADESTSEETTTSGQTTEPATTVRATASEGKS